MSTRTGSSWLFGFRGNELLVCQEGGAVRLPRAAEWDELGLAGEVAHPVGTLAGEESFALELPAEMEAPEGMAFHGLRKLWGPLEEEAWRLAGRAVQIVDWDRNHRFCGRCGTPTELSPDERSRTC